jgi:hypothetical protein
MKQYIPLSFILGVSLAVFLLSCHDDTVKPDIQEDFPNSIGSSWEYFLYDSLTDRIDTVSVAITDTTTLPNDEQSTIWIYTYSDKTDTTYVSISGDTVKLYYDVNALWNYRSYIFPLEVGNTWIGGNGDSTIVVTSSAISVTAGEFQNGFLIETNLAGFNRWGTISSWFVPHIGPVRMHRKEFALGPFKNETWELLDYTLMD